MFTSGNAFLGSLASTAWQATRTATAESIRLICWP